MPFVEFFLAPNIDETMIFPMDEILGGDNINGHNLCFRSNPLPLHYIYISLSLSQERNSLSCPLPTTPFFLYTHESEGEKSVIEATIISLVMEFGTSRVRFLFLLLQFLLYSSTNAAAAALNVPAAIPFDKGFTQIFGDRNLVRSSDENSVQIHLNQYTGAGFRSSDLYNHGLFSARIKLPSDYTAGVVVAFYATNGDVFEKTHDELDFEFLGNIKGKAWRFQTNLYGNGSTSRGREERYYLWFDPSKEYHRYTILWTTTRIMFYIDDVPVREILRSDEMGNDFPSKPMALYATIWDASTWATSGGRYKVNYKYAPFVAEFRDLVLHGCTADPIQEVFADDCDEKEDELEAGDYANVTPSRRAAMKRFRQKYMYYSYCYDTLRYPVPLPECVIDPSLRQRFKETGRLKFERRHSKRRSQVTSNMRYGDQDED